MPSPSARSSGGYVALVAVAIPFAYSLHLHPVVALSLLLAAILAWRFSVRWSSLFLLLGAILAGPVAVCVALAALIVTRRLDAPRWRALGYRAPLFMLLGALCGGAAYLIYSWQRGTGWGARSTPIDDVLSWFDAHIGSTVVLVVAVALVALLNGLIEELIFREYVVAVCMNARAPVAVTIAVSAITFGASHAVFGVPGGVAGVIATTCFGALVAIIRVKDKAGLSAAIATHAAADFALFCCILFVAS